MSEVRKYIDEEENLESEREGEGRLNWRIIEGKDKI